MPKVNSNAPLTRMNANFKLPIRPARKVDHNKPTSSDKMKLPTKYILKTKSQFPPSTGKSMLPPASSGASLTGKKAVKFSDTNRIQNIDGQGVTILDRVDMKPGAV